MSIFVIGINHKTAPVSIRERVYFAKEMTALYLQDLLSREVAKEAILLSTCNRSELYCNAEDLNAIYDWFCSQATMTREELESVLYTYKDEAALAHIMAVACGLDSMVLGEPQILGQMKEAFSESCTVSAISTSFHRLFQQVFAIAKEIRTTTAIGACPVSVASAAIHFAKQKVDLHQAKVVLVGLGDTTLLLLRYLKPLLTQPIILINRSVEKAQTFMSDFDGKVYGLEKLPFVLTEADIVFTATGSAHPIIKKEMVLGAMQNRLEQPITFIDVAVPRDVEASVRDVPGANLYCIDDLKAIIEQNRQGREHAASKAREMIRNKSAELMDELRALHQVSHTIRAYRGQIEEICRIELTKAKRQLQQGLDAAQVLDTFAHAFIRKLLHAPSVQLRQAGAEGRLELLRLAEELFALPDSELERAYEAIHRN